MDCHGIWNMMNPNDFGDPPALWERAVYTSTPKDSHLGTPPNIATKFYEYNNMRLRRLI